MWKGFPTVSLAEFPAVVATRIEKFARMTHHQWDFLADAVNPVLLCVFLAAGMARFPSFKRAQAFLIRTGVAVLLTYVFAHLTRWMHLWRDHPGFPSGHMTFFLTVATAFFLLDRRSALFTVPLAMLYGGLIVFLGFHSWLDLLGAPLLAVPVTLLCHRDDSGRNGNP